MKSNKGRNGKERARTANSEDLDEFRDEIHKEGGMSSMEDYELEAPDTIELKMMMPTFLQLCNLLSAIIIE